MDAHLDTFTTKLYQVNTHVNCITRRQVHLGGFAASPSPSLDGLVDEDGDDGADDDDKDEDEDASSSCDEETTNSQ